jgi:hypothetical protein
MCLYLAPPSPLPLLSPLRRVTVAPTVSWLTGEATHSVGCCIPRQRVLLLTGCPTPNEPTLGSSDSKELYTQSIALSRRMSPDKGYEVSSPCSIRTLCCCLSGGRPALSHSLPETVYLAVYCPCISSHSPVQTNTTRPPTFQPVIRNLSRSDYECLFNRSSDTSDTE